MASPPPPPPPPVGEDSWTDYIDQQTRHADTLEKRIHAIELYRSAVNAEPGSIKVWVSYCDYFWSLHRECTHPSSITARWPADELAAARDIFSLDAALHLWSEGHQATMYRLSDGNVLWDRWIALERDLLDKTRTSEGVKRITHLYRNRLATPHSTWDATSQMFSNFLSEYNPVGYEEIMQDVTQRAADAKKLYGYREHLETKLQRAVQVADVEAQKAAVTDYLGWEIANTKKERKDRSAAIQLGLGLFSRALTGILASDEATWSNFIVYVSGLRSTFGAGTQKNDELFRLLPNSIDVLQRAVQHCPWSGSLWARYVLSGEEAGLAFSDMERIKHAATNNSQLDRDGMTAVVDMYAAWCGYLKRTAMHPGATDDAVDIADSGMVAALEAVQVWGERRFGDAYQGDPNFRLERILVQYLTEKHAAIDEARDQWAKLATKDLYANSYHFWLTYFMWEMLVFQAQKGTKARSPTPGSSSKGLRVPTLATAVLERAVHNRNLDWPERVIEVYLHHCNDYETSDTLRRALDTVHKMKQVVARRREHETTAAQAAYAVQAQAAAADAAGATPEESSAAAKRKREASPGDGVESGSKRLKNEAVGKHGDDSQDQKLKRDRENTTVFVTNLPAEVSATKVKGYFKDFGHINNLQVQKEADGKSSVALIEYGSPDDVRSVLIRDGKYFGEQQIAIKPATNLTLFVTNYPPTADEAYVRNLFKDCGDIFAVRWPSLKYNAHRRFCYVTFRDLEASTKATKLDGTLLEKKYKLVATYSDPSVKKSRDGAVAEGREVHVTGLDRNVDEKTLQDVCARYGEVNRVRILRNFAGKSRGTAFVVYETKADADRAVSELNNMKLQSQIMQVELSVPSNYKPSAKTGGAGSPSPGPSGRDNEDDEDMTGNGSSKPSKEAANARTFALLGIPDTVNDARVRALVEPHGALVKLVLRPDHGGAVVEMVDAATAGKAELALWGVELDGRPLRTGTVGELFRAKAETRIDRIDKGPGAAKAAAAAASSASALMPPPPRVHRPAAKQGGAKRGLGYKAPGQKPKAVVGLMANGEAAAANGAEEEGTAAPPIKKSNADFRSLFLGGDTEKKTEKEAAGSGDKESGPVQNGH